MALLSGREGQAPGADIVEKGCPSEGCLWLLRTGPAAVGEQERAGRPGKGLGPHLRGRRATSELSFPEAHDENFPRGHSFPGG